MRNVTVLITCLFTASVSAAESNGEYIARISDCVACHTAEGGAAMAGGKKFPTPVGDIYSTNITPDKTHGIGNYSYDDFEKAVRQGIAKDGHPLYPAMPYPSYSKLSDADVQALYSYFMHDVKPSAEPNKENAIPWLISARWPLHIWNWLFTNAPTAAVEDNKADDTAARVKRGAYLVEGPGHCGSCHTPRGMAMNEKAYTNADAEYLSGAMIDGWYAPSLRGTGMSEQALTSLLLTGKSKHAAVSGSMSEVVSQSTQYLTDEDAQYLLSLKSAKTESARTAAATASWSNSPEAGKVTYNRYCSTCHGLEGKGTDDNAPSLIHNPLVMVDDPTPLFRVIAHGAETPTTRGNVSFKMPAYGGLLSDSEMRDVINYVRKSWGEGNGEVSQEDLSGIKKASH
ncbi:c-type cytochrome [Citrobacter sp. RHBSTW-00271]|uniref:c-type cytochrome n=1 Tax=Citrobacter sp. RHBSTW-00271 TaxID=2742642 RepID=UPI0015FA25E9|nr:cytochrome c [Citrobacter sp. RHBSTW-00271]MBA7943828.1 cytochrome c [Citrobacter sp. RHBSTW-00271]